MQSQVRRRDVLAAARCVDDGSGVSHYADVGRCDIAQRDAGGGVQACAAACGRDVGVSCHGQSACFCVHTDRARRAGADIHQGGCAAAQQDIGGRLQGDVARATDDVAVDNKVAHVHINQDGARAVGADRCAVHACTCGVGCAVVQGDRAARYQDDVAVGACHQVALSGICHGAGCGRSAEVGDADRHRIYRHCVVFSQEDARCRSARAQCRHRCHVGREVASSRTDGIVSLQSQVRRRDVLAAACCVRNRTAASPHRHIGRRQVSKSHTGTGSQTHGRIGRNDVAAAQHNDCTTCGQQMDGAS